MRNASFHFNLYSMLRIYMIMTNGEARYMLALSII